jgi:hypothetical protein
MARRAARATGSRHSRLCRLTPDADAEVLLTMSSGARRCAAVASAASRCVNEPNGLKSTQLRRWTNEDAGSKVWLAVSAVCDPALPLNRRSINPLDALMVTHKRLASLSNGNDLRVWHLCRELVKRHEPYLFDG